jgi:uracil-DNA glycosylase
MRPMDNEMWNKIFFTMSVLFTRQGRHFRGSDNFDEKISSQLSSPYLKQQLDIVRPKVIIPLGNLAFSSVNKYFNLGYEKQKISEVIKSLEPKGYIVSKDTIIIPNYHPAAHISPIVMKNIWRIVWDFV